MSRDQVARTNHAHGEDYRKHDCNSDTVCGRATANCSQLFATLLRVYMETSKQSRKSRNRNRTDQKVCFFLRLRLRRL